MFLDVRDIRKSFGKNEVLKGISFVCERGEFVSVIGPSGTGKTTLLKIIAGIESASDGDVRIASLKDIRRNPPILVFQDYMLFPYMNVFENVAFGLRARRFGKVDVKHRVEAILSFFRLEDKAGAFPSQLSGGQQQRVSLARALVLQPELLLLDEPYANLDRNLKLDTARFIRETQLEFGITTVCVTHDIEEALATSDSIGVLLDGELADWGPPERLYAEPDNLESARFFGELNEIPSTLYPSLGIDEEGSEVIFARNEAVHLSSAGYTSESPSVNMTERSYDPPVMGLVVEKKFLGTSYRYRMELLGAELTCLTMDGAFQPGDRVEISLESYLRPKADPNHIHGEKTQLEPVRYEDRNVQIFRRTTG
ncbi:MAG: ABC transporter ATP-binding protein [Spirochaetota bacterium]|nr:ABC transporter ATP-binding protein [Spirochaetota bacterium]